MSDEQADKLVRAIISIGNKEQADKIVKGLETLDTGLGCICFTLGVGLAMIGCLLATIAYLIAGK
jgi:hypothetical protein